jgi:hypothetical protein
LNPAQLKGGVGQRGLGELFQLGDQRMGQGNAWIWSSTYESVPSLADPLAGMPRAGPRSTAGGSA